MIIKGSYFIKVKRKTLWKYLLDPKVLEKIIPGVKKIKKKGDTYKSEIALNMAFFKAVYKGQFKIKKKKKPKSMLIVLKGSSKNNSIKAKARVKLQKAKGGTIVSYESDVDVSGGLSLFGSRMINNIAAKIAAQFFNNLEKQISNAKAD